MAQGGSQHPASTPEGHIPQRVRELLMNCQTRVARRVPAAKAARPFDRRAARANQVGVDGFCYPLVLREALTHQGVRCLDFARAASCSH
jgi:hypothetical protein